MPSGNMRIEAYPAHRFAVEIDGISEAVFSECILPPMEVEVHEQKEGGYNHGVHLLPGPVKAGRLTLKRGVAQASTLLEWYRQVANGQVKEATRNVSVVMYDATLQEVMRWDFEQAYPVKWSAPTLKSDENTVAIETLELAFAILTVK